MQEELDNDDSHSSLSDSTGKGSSHHRPGSGSSTGTAAGSGSHAGRPFTAADLEQGNAAEDEEGGLEEGDPLLAPLRDRTPAAPSPAMLQPWEPQARSSKWLGLGHDSAGHDSASSVPFASQGHDRLLRGRRRRWAPLHMRLHEMHTCDECHLIWFWHSPTCTHLATCSMRCLPAHRRHAGAFRVHTSVIEYLLVPLGGCRVAMHVEFYGLGLVLRSSGKKLLRNVTGKVRHSRLTAIMGPSGSGAHPGCR